MNWNSEAIIISNIASGESGSVVVAFTKDHGKWSGYSNLTKNKKVSIGDICYTSWNSRVDEGLGSFKLETIYSPYQYNFFDNLRLLAIQSICQLLNIFLADRDPHIELYSATEEALKNISLAQYAAWELYFLQYTGYGLDLSRCAVTGKNEGLFYISPKTGRCVIKDVGEPYKNSLFTIPNFWLKPDYIPSMSEINESLKITEYFIKKTGEHKTFYRDMLAENVAEAISACI